MKLTCAVVCAAILATTMACMGQAPSRSKAAAAPAGLSVEDVIKLAKAGLSEDIILHEIKKRNHAFELTTDQIIALKTANVSDRVVAVMIDPSKPEAKDAVRAEAPAQTAPPSMPPPVEPRSVEPPASAPAPVETGSGLPGEVGVYARKQNRWEEVAPEIVYWKTGGALKTIATAGILRGDVNGRVPGVSSHTSFATPLELLIVAPEGVVVEEYQLVRLRPNKDSREFRTVTGGVLHSQSGAFRDMVSFGSKKVASRTYQATFPLDAGPGEYGLLPPGSSNGSGKIYSFRIRFSEEN